MRVKTNQALISLFILLSLAHSLFSSSASAGPWQLDTSFNDSDTRSLLAQLDFQLLPASPDSWLISSSVLMLSNPQGLGPNVTLSSSCDTASSICVSGADIYQSVNGTLLRVGHLHSTETSIFQLPPSVNSPSPGNASSERPVSSIPNESNTVLGSLSLPLSLPLEWLWAIALIFVLLITITFLARNRD